MLSGTGYFFDDYNRLIGTSKYLGYFYLRSRKQIKVYCIEYKTNGQKKMEGYGADEDGYGWKFEKIGKWKDYRTLSEKKKLGKITFNKNDYNLYDSSNLKTGFWVENINGFITDAYYLKGKLNWMQKVYYHNGTLKYISFYSNGKQSGSKYYFNEQGFVVKVSN